MDVYSADVYISAVSPSANAGYDRSKSGFIVKYRGGSQSLKSSAASYINSGASFHLGDAAAGIVIDISTRNGVTLVRQVGLKNERQIWTITSDGVHFANISTTCPADAVLMFTGSTSPFFKVYNQEWIPGLTLVNRTDLDVSSRAWRYANTSFIAPTVSLTYLSSSFRHSGAQASANATPAVILESRAGGGIHLGGLIANPTGTVRILFTGENPGALTSIGAMSPSSGLTNVAPIWAHALTISGASSVGTASKPILAFLFGLGDEDPSVSAVATGDMHMELTPAELKMVASIPNSPDTTALKYRLRLVQALTDRVNAIRSARACASIKRPAPRWWPCRSPARFCTWWTRWWPVRQRRTVQPRRAEPLPRQLRSGERRLQLPAAQRHQIYTDEEAACCASPRRRGLYGSHFNFTLNESGAVTQISLAQGVRFDVERVCCPSGGFNFKALLSAIKGSWIMNHLGTGTDQFTFLYGYQQGNDGIYTPLESTLTLCARSATAATTSSQTTRSLRTRSFRGQGRLHAHLRRNRRRPSAYHISYEKTLTAWRQRNLIHFKWDADDDDNARFDITWLNGYDKDSPPCMGCPNGGRVERCGVGQAGQSADLCYASSASVL